MKITREELVEKLNIKDVDPHTQDIIISEFMDAIDTRIFAKASERLSEDDLEELSKLIDKDDEGGVEWFIKSKFDHYDDFIDQLEQELIEQTAHNIQSVNTSLEDPNSSPSSMLNL